MIEIHASVYRAPSAELYGRITVGEGSSLWPRCVIRAECQHVTIGRMTNVQDGVMIHVGYDHPTVIGDHCSITHQATVHGAVVEDDCLIGIQAVVMDGAVIGRGSIVAPGAVVREGQIIPPHSIVAGVPAAVRKTHDSTVDNRMNAWAYWRNAEGYLRGDHRAWDEGFAEWRRAKRKEIEAEVGG